MKPRSALHPYWMLAPTALLLSLFFLYPLVIAAKNSLYSWDLLTPPTWVGLRNYRVLGESGELLGVLGRTLGYSAVVVSLSVSLGLALAVALNRPGRVYAFVRGAVFSAYVVSWVAVALLWMWILDADGGLLALIACLGLAQLSHETTPAVAQIGFTTLTLFGMAATPWRTLAPAVALLLGLAGMALSGAPAMALLLATGGVAINLLDRNPATRQRSRRWALCMALLACAVAAPAKGFPKVCSSAEQGLLQFIRDTL